MARRPVHPPLRVLLNNRLVGHLKKAASGAIAFKYDHSWLEWEHALPVSLSLPLRDDPYRGQPVAAVFDNLLPDTNQLRRRVAEKVGAAGTDAYSLLAVIGHDCVGALQFLADDDDIQHQIGHADTNVITGVPVTDSEIENLLNGLAQAPLGLSRDDPFRISVAGAQEKTALLWYEGRWHKPLATTPTSHILKTQIGQLPNGIDLSDSVENEYYCLRFASLCGLPVNGARIETFGRTRALVIERFDRHWASDGRLLRLPQEDCCQALSIPPTRKYQNEGGPGLVEILELLNGSDEPARDQRTVFKAQILFWLLGATDGHAKNFSLFIGPGGSYRLTPLYDILTTQPSLEERQIEPKQMKLAMSLGSNRHYKVDEILGRHFRQSARQAGMPEALAHEAMDEMAEVAVNAVGRIGNELPDGFPAPIHDAVSAAVVQRARRLKTTAEAP